MTDAGAARAVDGIEEVTYGVEDVDTVRAFFETFGLERTESTASGAAFHTPEGAGVRVVASGDASLARFAPLQPGPTVRDMVWSVADRAALDALGAELGADRDVTLDAGGTLRTVDAMGLSIGFRVSSVVRAPHVSNATHAPTTRAPIFERAKPVHLGHIVFFTGNFDESIRFYTERLGFTLSDTLTLHGNAFGAFLRALGAINHHNLFFIKSSGPGINHLSFRVGDISEMMAGRTFMERNGFPCEWGLGRHAPSSAMFNYFPCPAGGFAEYHFDEDVILDPSAWQPKVWDVTEPGSANQWVGRPPEALQKGPQAVGGSAR